MADDEEDDDEEEEEDDADILAMLDAADNDDNDDPEGSRPYDADVFCYTKARPPVSTDPKKFDGYFDDGNASSTEGSTDIDVEND